MLYTEYMNGILKNILPNGIFFVFLQSLSIVRKQ
jgi:hypothetical protein